MSRLSLLLTATLLTCALSACVPITPPAAPAAAPAPAEIVVNGPSGTQTLTPGDTGFDTISASLPTLIGGITAQVRTVFPPDRFAAEIAPLPHIQLRYAAETGFSGQGIAWRAVEMVIAAPDGEVMLLARAAGVEDWSVFAPNDPAPLRDFLTRHTQ